MKIERAGREIKKIGDKITESADRMKSVSSINAGCAAQAAKDAADKAAFKLKNFFSIW